MNIVCTLFEGNYHKGVAVLINSLLRNGFRGDFVVGYRGDLPNWGLMTEENLLLEKVGVETWVLSGFSNKVHFIEIGSNSHFTNYKPKFMLDLFELFPTIDSLYYFDPDITNTARWPFYEEWSKCGVAVVHEIVWNDMPSTHPKRIQWMAVAESLGLSINKELNSYINAGFVGIHRENIEFVNLWHTLIQHATEKFGFDIKSFAQSSRNEDLFKVGDQDLFNLTAMLTNCKLSEFGPEGMGFIGGGWIMFHSTGSPKPWNKNYFKQFLRGKKPSIPDKEFWKYASGPIKVFSKYEIKRKIGIIKICSFLSRFYRA